VQLIRDWITLGAPTIEISLLQTSVRHLNDQHIQNFGKTAPVFSLYSR
jgi:hypothetical protein